jgi:hypothetical protein
MFINSDRAALKIVASGAVNFLIDPDATKHPSKKRKDDAFQAKHQEHNLSTPCGHALTSPSTVPSADEGKKECTE